MKLTDLELNLVTEAVGSYLDRDLMPGYRNRVSNLLDKLVAEQCGRQMGGHGWIVRTLLLDLDDDAIVKFGQTENTVVAVGKTTEEVCKRVVERMSRYEIVYMHEAHRERLTKSLDAFLAKIVKRARSGKLTRCTDYCGNWTFRFI